MPNIQQYVLTLSDLRPTGSNRVKLKKVTLLFYHFKYTCSDHSGIGRRKTAKNSILRISYLSYHYNIMICWFGMYVTENLRVNISYTLVLAVFYIRYHCYRYKCRQSLPRQHEINIQTAFSKGRYSKKFVKHSFINLAYWYLRHFTDNRYESKVIQQQNFPAFTHRDVSRVSTGRAESPPMHNQTVKTVVFKDINIP